jgi:hypothetical protein
MELHKSNFLAITQEQDIQGIKIQWLEGSARMDNQQFKEEILSEIKALEKVRPANIFADTLQMRFTIGSDLQEWHNNQVFPVFQSVGVRKLAVLVSTDLFAQVAIQQLVEDGSDKKLITRYFDAEIEAINWLRH